MTTAWRRTPHTDNGEPDAAEALLKRHLGSAGPDEADAARAEKIRERTRAQYLDQLQNAWRSPNPQSATAIERQGEQFDVAKCLARQVDVNYFHPFFHRYRLLA